MQKVYLFTSMIILFTIPGISQTHFTFGIKPGQTINAAYIGISQKKWIAYLGSDLLSINASVKYEETSENYETIGNSTYRTLEFETTDYRGNGFLLIPHLGVKYFFNMNSVRPFLFGSIFVSFPLVKLDADGSSESWHYENNQLKEHETETIPIYTGDIKESIKSILSFWGFNLGAGGEYFFNPHFSIGGEYGIRIIFDKADYQEKNDKYIENTYPSDKFQNNIQTEITASLKLSYVAVSLNFYF